MAFIVRDLHSSGEAPIPFQAAVPGGNNSMTKSPAEATANADARFRHRFDFEGIEVPRGESSCMFFFERKRRSEMEDLTAMRMRLVDDHELLKNKPFPLFPVSYRFPMQCTRMACVAKSSAAVIGTGVSQIQQISAPTANMSKK